MSASNIPAPGTNAAVLYEAGKKSIVVSYLLWFFLGTFSAHRFYNGRWATALLQLALLIGGVALFVVSAAEINPDAPAADLPPAAMAGMGVMGLWALWLLVDAFLIPGWVRRHNNDLAARVASA